MLEYMKRSDDMKWLNLIEKIGKQELNKMRKTDVVILIDDKEVPVTLKFKTDGTPYLIPDNERVIR